MNASSIAVLSVIGILFALAVRRVLKKGAPCECGGSRGGGCGGCCGGKCSSCRSGRHGDGATAGKDRP